MFKKKKISFKYLQKTENHKMTRRLGSKANEIWKWVIAFAPIYLSKTCKNKIILKTTVTYEPLIYVITFCLGPLFSLLLEHYLDTW